MWPKERHPNVPTFSRLQGSLSYLIPTDMECALFSTALGCQLSLHCISAPPKERWHLGQIPTCSDLSVFALICCSEHLCPIPLSTLQPCSRLLPFCLIWLGTTVYIDSISSLSFPKHNKDQVRYLQNFTKAWHYQMWIAVQKKIRLKITT